MRQITNEIFPNFVSAVGMSNHPNLKSWFVLEIISLLRILIGCNSSCHFLQPSEILNVVLNGERFLSANQWLSLFGLSTLSMKRNRINLFKENVLKILVDFVLPLDMTFSAT